MLIMIIEWENIAVIFITFKVAQHAAYFRKMCLNVLSDVLVCLLYAIEHAWSQVCFALAGWRQNS